MTRRPAAFAIPGDITTVTGGYIYERRLLEELRILGHDVSHIQLGDSFPDPSPQDMAHAVETLVSLEPERALILDGLVFGSIDTRGLSRVRAPIVAMVHHPLALETGLDRERRDHLSGTERANLSLAAHVLVPSPHTAHILTKDYAVPGDKITIARPGTERPAGRRTPTDPPLILSVGIQHPRKGHDVLLCALAELRDLPWRAVIVGSVYDADHGAELVRLVEELGLGDRVTLGGRLPQSALDDLFTQATIFALATRYEGYGMVFDEALAWGLPIVSCDTGAVPQTIPPEVRLLVPPGEAAPFAEALRCLLEDPALRSSLAEAARLAGASLLGWPETARLAGQVLDGLRPVAHT